MAEHSKIEWCDHTFNPWVGCTEVSPGCANCYAEGYGKRFGVEWGLGQPRRRTSAANWKKPLAWARKARGPLACMCDHGTRSHCSEEGACNEPGCDCQRWVAPPSPRVFCGSLCDWLDPEVPIGWLADLLDLIDKTRGLRWLLLTKRPELWRERIEAVCEWNRGERPSIECPACFWLDGEPLGEQVWLGATVEDQRRADERIPVLLRIPATRRFLSCEPLLGEVYLPDGHPGISRDHQVYLDGISWVIAGGESGPIARPMHPDWARSLRDQCSAAGGVPFLFKQWGEWAPDEGPSDGSEVCHVSLNGEVLGKGDPHPLDAAWMRRLGKKHAGRLLDGLVWNEVPK